MHLTKTLISTTCALLLGAPALLAACDSGGDGATSDTLGGDTAATPMVDATAVATTAMAYKAGGFTRITEVPAMSQHQGSDVVVWAQNDVAAIYRAADPANTSASVAFPEGATIVKEQLDDQGEMYAITVMHKGPAGYAPDSDDWFFERVEKDGTISQQGQVGFCITCHSPRKPVDWVFGITAANQTAQ
ncbi:MAG: cytochrome P460 family protein [Deltaproteobacteria bacterium]|nr:cytochrome P460 family protein [Deltaproteobacteria bacterium]